MNYKLLQQWADKLRQIDPKHFNISNWVTGHKPEALTLDHNCGTAACAAGYLPLFFPNDWIHDKWGEPGYKDGGPDCVGDRWTEQGGDYISCDAERSVGEYFEIEPWVVENIIQGYKYLDLENKDITPTHVADRIEAIIEWGKSGSEGSINTYLQEVGK